MLVKDIVPTVLGTPLSSRPHDLVGYKGLLYFFVESDAQSTGSLWKSGGTESGTIRVTALTNAANPYPGGLLPLNGILIFSAATPEAGWEMWRTDGTAASTMLLKDIAPGAQSALGGTFYNSQRNIANTLFFSPDDGVHGSELWTSDGTAAGTRLLQDIAPGSMSSTPAEYTAVQGQVVFTADDGMTGRELWALPLSQQRLIYLPLLRR